MEYMDGGSLDLILQKTRIPEPMLGTITAAVSKKTMIFYYKKKKMYLLIF